MQRIKHVIYIIKENRTYDQVFGSLGKGNGDPSLTTRSANRSGSASSARLRRGTTCPHCRSSGSPTTTRPHYDTASTVATVESVLGLPPMSIFDARAARMWRSFTDHPRFRRYHALTPTVTPFGGPGSPVNSASAPMARQSAGWNFSREDLAPEGGLNRAIWESIRGRHSRMPVPRQAYAWDAGSKTG